LLTREIRASWQSCNATTSGGQEIRTRESPSAFFEAGLGGRVHTIILGEYQEC